MAKEPINKKSDHTDLRKYASQTNRRSVIWFVLILIIVGLGLVWLIYGRSAALLGFFCLLGTGIPISLIAVIILGLDRFVKKSN